MQSDNQDIEKNNSDVDNNSNHENGNGGSRDYISSPGYDTSSSTAPASSPDPCEYEGSIQAYKSRSLSIQSTHRNNIGFKSSSASSFYASSSKDSTPERNDLLVVPPPPPPKRPSSTKIENRLLNFEIKGSSQEERSESSPKKDLPKVDILKRRELFEKETSPSVEKATNRLSNDFSQAISLRERMSNLEKRDEVKDASIKKLNRLSGEEFGSVKDRLTNIEREPQIVMLTEKPAIDVPIVALKDRLSSLHANVKLAVDADYTTNDIVELHPIHGPLHNMTNHLHYFEKMDAPLMRFSPTPDLQIDHFVDTDREDSGIHTADVSCAVSQNDEPIEEITSEERPTQTQVKNIHIDHPAPANSVPDVVPVDKPQSIDRQEPSAPLETTNENDINSSLPIDVIAELSSLEQESSVSAESVSITKPDDQIDKPSSGDTFKFNDQPGTETNPDSSSSNVVDTTNTNLKKTEEAPLLLTTSETPVVVTNPNEENAIIFTLFGSAAAPEQQQQQPVVEICNKIDVNSLADRDHIPTPFINVDATACKRFINAEMTDHSPTTHPEAPFESIESKNQRLKCQIVGMLEKNKNQPQLDIQMTADDDNSSTTVSTAPLSPASSTRSSASSKSSTKNIFDFIKQNLLNETNDNLLEKSTFYVALNEHQMGETYLPVDEVLGVGSKVSDHCKTDSLDSQSSEIGHFLDEELEKLN